MPREKLTKNFARVEFQCPCCMKCEMRSEFMDALQRLRDEYGKPMTINSGFRCVKHNERVRGAKDSQHTYGNAVDIACDNIFDRDRILELAYKFGFTGKEVSPVHVHLDMRSSSARLIWTDLRQMFWHHISKVRTRSPIIQKKEVGYEFLFNVAP